MSVQKKLVPLFSMLLLLFVSIAYANEPKLAASSATLAPHENGYVWEARGGIWGYYPTPESGKTGHYELKAIRLINNGTGFVQAPSDTNVTVTANGEIVISRKQNPRGGASTKASIQPYGVGDLGYRPTYFNVWPYSSNSINPEEQYFWYHSGENAIYIGFANAIPMPVGPQYALDLEELPSENVTGKYNVSTVAQNMNMRTRLHMLNSNNGWGIQLTFRTPEGAILAAPYLCMSNAGGSYNGWVHFFKLFNLSGLSQLPTSGSFTLSHPTGAQAYQQIRFDNSYGINAFTWVYVP